MDANQIIITVFGLIGALFVVIILYYLFRRYYESARPKQDFPPNNYMRYVGTQCPDYWDIDKINNQTVLCKNKFNVPVIKNTSPRCEGVPCSSDTGVPFQAINNYPINKTNSRMRERCLWRECCTSDGSTPAAWIGLEGSC